MSATRAVARVSPSPTFTPRSPGSSTANASSSVTSSPAYSTATAASDDGLPGSEGLFLACSFWMVDALHLAGRQDHATQLFERLLDLRNDVGLLSEEWDPVAGRQLGNTPQAFSHFALVTSGLQLHAGRGHGSHEPIRHPGVPAD